MTDIEPMPHVRTIHCVQRHQRSENRGAIGYISAGAAIDRVKASFKIRMIENGHV